MIRLEIVDEEQRIINVLDYSDITSLNFDRFWENPVLLFQHNSLIPPIGKVLEIKPDCITLRIAPDSASTTIAPLWATIRTNPERFSLGFGHSKGEIVEFSLILAPNFDDLPRS